MRAMSHDELLLAVMDCEELVEQGVADSHDDVLLEAYRRELDRRADRQARRWLRKHHSR
jgi:hypothetical protein